MKFYCKEIKKSLTKKKWVAILFSNEEIEFDMDSLKWLSADLTVQFGDDQSLRKIVRPCDGSLLCEYKAEEEGLSVCSANYIPKKSKTTNTVYIIKTTQRIDENWDRPKNIFENKAFSSKEEAENKLSEILECDLDIVNATITAINVM